jgi:hypothetical protein
LVLIGLTQRRSKATYSILDNSAFHDYPHPYNALLLFRMLRYIEKLMLIEPIPLPRTGPPYALRRLLS